MSAVPKRLGPFEVDSFLGRGGASEVFRARRPGDRQPVALKVLRPGRTRNDRQRFLREAEIARKLDHPNLVKVVDADLAASRPWLALELVEGGNLATLMEQAHSRILRLAPRICIGLLQALVALGEAGLIHRDISPANVLVSPDDRVRLIDVGLVEQEGGGAAGTLAYLSPEALRGEKVGAASDLYQVGAILYEVFAEYVPFEDRGANYLELRAFAEAPPTELTRFASGISSAVSRLIGTLLAPEPEDRPDVPVALRRARSIPAPWVHQMAVAPLFDRGERDEAHPLWHLRPRRRSRRLPESYGRLEFRRRSRVSRGIRMAAALGLGLVVMLLLRCLTGS